MTHKKQSLLNEKHLPDTANKKLLLPDNISTCELFSNLTPRGPK